MAILRPTPVSGLYVSAARAQPFLPGLKLLIIHATSQLGR